MKITLNVILELLTQKGLSYSSNLVEGSFTSFSRVCLLSNDREELCSDYIYISALTDALNNEYVDDSKCILCLRDRIQDAYETPERMRGKIVVSANISLTTLYNMINSKYIAISEWVSAMQSAIIKNREIKEVLDLCTTVIPNSINITDASMRLIACTDNETDDAITLRLRQFGYHPEESLVMFRNGGYFRQWSENSELFITERSELGKYCMVNKVFKFKDSYFFHVVMVCDHIPPTPGMIDLFSVLLDTIQDYIYRKRDYMLKSGNRSEALILDILNKNISRENDITERARFADIPYVGDYVLNVIGINSQYLVSISRLRSEISLLFPGSYTAIYNQRVIILSSSGYFRDENDRRAQLNDLLTKYDAVCAESIPFSDLGQLLTAYRQSALILKHIDTLKTMSSVAEGESSCFFSFLKFNMYLYLLEASDDLSIWDNSPYITAVRNLVSLDSRKGTDNARTLYLYLTHERNGTIVGKMIHMHRNNIAYRIARICESQNLDLDDPSVRFGLMLAFVILKPFASLENS